MADILDTPTLSRASLLAWLNGRQGPQSVLAAGVAVLVAAGATVALRSADPASADTRVVVARLAQVYLPDGTNHPAVEGEVLPRGAELHTGQQGGAQLSTAGRRVYLGGLSTLVVRDGVREELARGQAMVDARDGAHLELTTPAGTVSTPSGAVSRVEEQLLTRVAAYHGTVTLHPVGRSSATAVPALHQLKVQPQSLPQRTTPLQLTREPDGRDGDAWDRAVAADLVSADQDLRDLADGLSHEEGATYLATVPASFRSGAVPAVGAARGEEALTVAVARAAAAPDALAQVRADRADLGSWGVVAALVRARVSDVSAVLSAALAPDTATNGSTNGTTVNAGPQPNLPGVVPVGTPSPSASRGPTTGPTTRPTTRPTTPTTSAPATEAVDGLVKTVLTLVSPSPAPAQRPTTPSPTPTPPCVLGLLLC